MEHKVRVEPNNIEISAEHGADLLSAITKSGLTIRATCGGKGTCGKCRVIIKKGNFETRESDCILACQTKVIDNLTVEIPLQYDKIFEAVERGNVSRKNFQYSPLGQELFARNKTGGAFGIALDIGTTTVVAQLIDLKTSAVLSAKGAYNRQISFGDDVITRIIYAEEKNGLTALTSAIRDTINELIGHIIKEEKISINDIYSIQIAGNTTMMHLFYNKPPRFIRRETVIPEFDFTTLKAKETGIKINPEGTIAFIPWVANYVGGDIVAGVLACDMDEKAETTLLIDLGTNGEIALGNRDWILCAACSAGPAFEGVGIKCGIHAMEGAIQSIEITDKSAHAKYSTIGNKKATGICGTGLLDIPAELLKKGIINRAGKFIGQSSPFLRKNDDDEFEFIVVSKENSATGDDIVITESDIANIIRSKGAVFLGMQVLLSHANLKFEDLDQIYISGGFGTYLDIKKAITVGLLPDLPEKKFKFIGNSSVQGAQICLLSQTARDKADLISKKMTYIDLSNDASFMNEYTSTLFLPHTNLDLFPSFKKLLDKR